MRRRMFDISAQRVLVHVLIVSLCTLGCEEPAGAPSDTLSVAPNQLRLLPADSQQIGAGVEGGLFPDDIVWASSDPRLVTVSETGLVRAVAPGTATVEVSSGSQRAEVTVEVVRSFSVVSINAAAVPHSCALKPDGKAYCWGTRWGPVPLSVEGNTSYSRLSSGNHTVCGLDLQGAASCWANSLTQPDFEWTLSPQEVPGGFTFRALSVASGHACGLTFDDRLYCWGQVPPGFSASDEPWEPFGPNTFASASAGSTDTCALDLAGLVFCLGGVLGSTDPIPFPPGVELDRVEVGNGHACGLTDSGEAYCWGFNFNGQLGRGTESEWEQPGPVTTELRFTSLVAGTWFTCGLDTMGDIYCWGSRQANGVESRLPVLQDAGISFVSFSASGRHVCGLTAVGTLYCWGESAMDALGDGSDAGSSNPVRVIDPTFIRIP